MIILVGGATLGSQSQVWIDFGLSSKHMEYHVKRNTLTNNELWVNSGRIQGA